MSSSFTYAFLDAALVPSDDATYSIGWNSVLPVMMNSFLVFAKASAARLEWSTATEQNNRSFSIEKSSDRINWQTIAVIASRSLSGTSTTPLYYSYDDRLPFAGVNYYRLKQANFDNTYQYSDTRELIFKTRSVLTVMPNPTNDRVTVTGFAAGSVLRLTNGSGHLLREKKVTGHSEIMELSGLKNGVYILQLIDKKTVIGSVRVVKK